MADQHAYLLQLKHIQADPELIERETLVERHLVKRQVCFLTELNQNVYVHSGYNFATFHGNCILCIVKQFRYLESSMDKGKRKS